MGRWIIALTIILGIGILGFSFLLGQNRQESQLETVLNVSMPDISGYERALSPLNWDFPRDFGAHDTYQTEWWYYTGNLEDENGRHFGYQFTIFRRAISPDVMEGASEWRDNQVYLAHFTLSDIDANQFYHSQSLSRGGADLAGALPDNANPDAPYHVWVEDWSIQAIDDESSVIRIQAAMDGAKIDLTLTQTKPPLLQGNAGLSPKSAEPGNASHYYSLSRLETKGSLSSEAGSFEVSGLTWMDHEFSTSALGEGAQGWDWFGLIFEEGYELMIGQIRLQEGGTEPAFGGKLLKPDGESIQLMADDFEIEVTDEWKSPHTQATYPAGWLIKIKTNDPYFEDGLIELRLRPLMADQELTGGGIDYWEGAVRIEGDLNGYGYAELTGYTRTMQGRF